MARKPRVHVPGGVYHVMVRGNGGQKIFYDAKDYSRFYLLLQEGAARFACRVHAFCCMGNHVHLAIQVGQVPLSKIVQNISFRYTRWINRRKRRIGHLFQGRYKAVLVDRDSYLLELTRYIHLNPVRGGLVKRPGEYRWSGHRAYVGKEKLPWLTTDWVLSQFGDRQSVAVRRYQEFVSEGAQEGHREEFHRGNGGTAILGDDRFIEKILHQKPDLISRGLTLNRLVDRVGKEYHLGEGQLAGVSRNRLAAEARAAIGYLTMQTRCGTLTEVARRFGRDVTTLSKGVQRIAERLGRSEAKLKRLLNLAT
ncbi:MAG: transposase [Gammaproteobacteria bacterium]|nr:transposase [Gammaproteobacteria bacterium]